MHVALDIGVVIFALHTGLALAGRALFASNDVSLDVLSVSVRLRDGPLALLLRHTLSFRLPRGSALVAL